MVRKLLARAHMDAAIHVQRLELRRTSCKLLWLKPGIWQECSAFCRTYKGFIKACEMVLQI